MQANIICIVTKDNQVVLLKVRKEYVNKPAHLMDVINKLANIADPDIFGIYRFASIASAVVVVLEVQDIKEQQ